MRPLPRVFAFTDDTICRRADFGVLAAAIASGGPAVALVIKASNSTPDQVTAFAERAMALAVPAEASVIVYGPAAVAKRVGAHGLHLTRDADAMVDGTGWVGRSAHDLDEARLAAARRPSYLLAGNVFPSSSDPAVPAHGLDWAREVSTLGVPFIAIGGITTDRVAAVRDTGAWGVAAQHALWDAPDPAKAVMEFLRPWTEA